MGGGIEVPRLDCPAATMTLTNTPPHEPPAFPVSTLNISFSFQCFPNCPTSSMEEDAPQTNYLEYLDAKLDNEAKKG
ncbi:hypothetical protein E2C01_076933 [Portunus trituberculatus]|uniref:Uncharacterized protein n=1 Tax=Portunus trituberculatus TaxID=210409 RepID=A0A5B7IKD2_PORTR|nr:hypothetical protein [Portunus trituberculatus]